MAFSGELRRFAAKYGEHFATFCGVCSILQRIAAFLWHFAANCGVLRRIAEF